MPFPEICFGNFRILLHITKSDLYFPQNFSICYKTFGGNTFKNIHGFFKALLQKITREIKIKKKTSIYSSRYVSTILPESLQHFPLRIRPIFSLGIVSTMYPEITPEIPTGFLGNAFRNILQNSFENLSMNFPQNQCRNVIKSFFRYPS